MTAGELPDGVYDRIITRGLDEQLQELKTVRATLEEAETPQALGEHLGRVAARELARLAPDQRVAAVNRLIEMLAPADTVLPGPEQLLALAQAEAPGVWRLLNVRPQVPLSRPALLTNASGDPKLGNELRAELATADHVDLLCAFVKWYGLRVLEAELKERHDRGVPLRVLTTTYMGATDRTALDRLVRDFGAQVTRELRNARAHACMRRRGCSGVTAGSAQHTSEVRTSAEQLFSMGWSGTSGSRRITRRSC